MMRRLLAAVFAILATAAILPAAARRVVVVKADGVPGALLESVREQRDPATGRSRLPWIDEVFGRRGTRLANFYVRGVSLSTPSWSLLDTGLDQRIHGNVEYDRLTLRPYDYLNFVPFFFKYALSRSVEMPGVEALDEAGVPLLIDHFAPEERFQSFQLFQRGNRWSTVRGALPHHLRLRGPWRLLEDSQTGLDISSSIGETTERDLLAHLRDPRIRYLDFFTGDYDHTAHLNNSREAQIRALQRLDALIGRLWTAIQATPQAQETVLVLVSDHGMNTEPGVLSQGFSLVEWLGGVSGGGHHVITNRYPLSEYRLHALNPFVSAVTTPSAVSPYLKDEAQRYPTALLDLDGNERAAIQLRNSDLNRLHILLQLMTRGNGKNEAIAPLADQFFAVLERRRAQWADTLAGLREEVAALHQEIERQRVALAAMPKRFTAEDRLYGRDEERRRLAAHIRSWEQEERSYGDYIRSLASLLSLRAGAFDPTKVDIAEVIPRRSLGEPNSIYDLQNYAIGPKPQRTMDYPRALKDISVRNVVQKEVGPDPVDFIVMPVPPDAGGLPAGEGIREAVWLYGGEERQALVLRRLGSGNEPEVRYLPIRRLKGGEDGSIHFEAAVWDAGFPLRLWEDPGLNIQGADRKAWLGSWHTERQWLAAVCHTVYSYGVVGVLEQFQTPEALPAPWDKDASPDERKMLLRVEARRRKMVEADMLVFASDHWNFNTRGFNPGGNHGSFFQRSAHATFLAAGGESTGVPRGRVVDQPYDSLSFAPTLLRLLDMESRPADPVMPGPVVQEITGGSR